MGDFDPADKQAAATPETKEAFRNENFKPSKSWNETYANKYMMGSRNPITGTGLNGDGVGGLKPKTAKDRGGNPLTGEGYIAGFNDFQVLKETKHSSLPYSAGHW